MNIEWQAEQLGLKKMGREYKGPCPVCGGNDRFHVKEGRNKPVIYHCRQGCTFPEIMRELESRGIIERDQNYQKPQFTNRHKQELVQSRMVVGMYETQKNAGATLTLDDYKAYKLAVNRVKGIESLMGIEPKKEYTFA